MISIQIIDDSEKWSEELILNLKNNKWENIGVTKAQLQNVAIIGINAQQTNNLQIATIISTNLEAESRESQATITLLNE